MNMIYAALKHHSQNHDGACNAPCTDRRRLYMQIAMLLQDTLSDCCHEAELVLIHLSTT